MKEVKTGLEYLQSTQPMNLCFGRKRICRKYDRRKEQQTVAEAVFTMAF